MLYVNRLLKLLIIFIVLISIASCGKGCSGCNWGTGTANNTTQPSLIAVYGVKVVGGTQPTVVTVTFKGDLTSASGTGSGSKTFSKIEQSAGTLGGSDPVYATARVYNLQPGTWTVTATPDCCGSPLTCTAHVPGIITLDVSGEKPICKEGL